MFEQIDLQSLLVGFIVYCVNYAIFFAIARRFIFGVNGKGSFFLFYLIKNLVLAGIILALVLIYHFQAFSLAIGMMLALFVVTIITAIFRN